MDLKEVYVILVTLLVAISGYIFTYFNQRRRDERLARLERINQQLEELYAPLYALLQANNTSWHAFSSNYWPAHGCKDYFEEGQILSDSEKHLWKLWGKEIFQPMNEQMVQLILAKSHLLDTEEMPQAFQELIAHVNSYKTLRLRWQEGDDDELYSPVNNFPRHALARAIEPTYRHLQQEQHKLMGLLNQSTDLSKIQVREFNMERGIKNRDN